MMALLSSGLALLLVWKEPATSHSSVRGSRVTGACAPHKSQADEWSRSLAHAIEAGGREVGLLLKQ